jgi:hypothetical protein
MVKNQKTTIRVYLTDSILLERVKKINEGKAETLQRILKEYCKPDDIKASKEKVEEWYLTQNNVV